MKKRIANYIPLALDALQEKIVKDGCYDNEYAGYIASFGPTVIQTGLLPATAFYSRKDSGTAGDRKKVGDAIIKVIAPNEYRETTLLLDYILLHNNKETKEKILDAVIALKLSIRTFKKNKKDNAEGEEE